MKLIGCGCAIPQHGRQAPRKQGVAQRYGRCGSIVSASRETRTRSMLAPVPQQACCTLTCDGARQPTCPRPHCRCSRLCRSIRLSKRPALLIRPRRDAPGRAPALPRGQVWRRSQPRLRLLLARQLPRLLVLRGPAPRTCCRPCLASHHTELPPPTAMRSRRRRHAPERPDRIAVVSDCGAWGARTGGAWR